MYFFYKSTVKNIIFFYIFLFIFYLLGPLEQQLLTGNLFIQTNSQHIQKLLTQDQKVINEELKHIRYQIEALKCSTME